MSRTLPIPTTRGRRSLGTLAVLALVAAWFALPTSQAQAGIGDFIVEADVDPTFEDERLAFDYSWEVVDDFGQDYECETDIAVYTLSFDNGSVPEELDTTVEVHEDDETSGTIVLPDLEGGDYELLFDVVTCAIAINGAGTPFTEGDVVSMAFARLLIDKDVAGDVPEGTTFTVEVACEPGVGVAGTEDLGTLEEHDEEGEVYERHFDEDGGTEVVYFYDPADCTITETEDGGAESTSIDPDEVEIGEPGDFSTTVTNTFPVADEVDEDEEDEEESEVEEEEEDLEEAEPAEPVEDEPDYTG